MPLLGSIIKKGIALRHKISFERYTPEQHQRKVLRQLLRTSQFTLFGQAYKFSKIIASPQFVTKFRLTVPVHDYNSIFSKWWNKSLHNQEDVCWPGQVKYFALSSGTSDSSSKHIPVTRDMIRSIQKVSIRQILSLAKYDLPESLFEKGILMLGGSTHLHQKGSYFEGDLSGITASNIPFWFQHFYKPGRKIANEVDWNAKLNEITEKAHEWDIGIIVGVPAWSQLLIEKVIERYKLKTIHDIWPNLSIYVHGGVSFEPYRKSFEKLLEKPLMYIETYLASEGFIAYQDEPGNRSMKLIINNGIFFEFIPFNDTYFNSEGEIIGKPKTLMVHEVEEGQDYAIMLSTNAGAWRYLIGDVVRFTNKEKCQIVIVGRTKHYLSLCGEHLSVDNMNKAIEMVSEELNIRINEFTVSGIPSGSLFAHKWYVGVDDPCEELQITEALDEKLKILNDDYRVERSSALNNIIVKVVPSTVFLNWMKMNNKVGAQNKFPRVMKITQFAKWEEFVDKELAENQA
ncbi:MAG: GH3 auxin-responsive promoter family protein [Bacteroidia bacterium]|nr:GH3 auxin-responsive promoter family protein [Bacteroidota bacterium]MBP9083217.1 GH3 auxin-responsive promoter family protein [Bacteroidia bacterium]